MAKSQKVSAQGSKPFRNLKIQGEHFYQFTVGEKLVSNQTYRSFL